MRRCRACPNSNAELRNLESQFMGDRFMGGRSSSLDRRSSQETGVLLEFHVKMAQGRTAYLSAAVADRDIALHNLYWVWSRYSVFLPF